MSARSGGTKPARKKSGILIVGENRRARFDYELLQNFEAGIELVGSEVKSLRVGKLNLSEAYAAMKGDELWLLNANISEYREANRFNHDPKRPRKLLLHRKEISRLAIGIQREGLTVVPLKLFFNPRGRAKVDIALARGKKLHDKRDTTKARDWGREKQRLLKNS
jgi:SsrA-binding protein